MTITLVRSVTVLTLALLGSAVPFGSALAADLILSNARIYTADAQRPWAEALAIAGDRIVAVGSGAEVLAHREADTRVIDLQGAFVTPGFNDAHVHMDSTGSLLTGVNLLDVH
ncbi:MAG: amidohydrolase family protein, partial [Pseudomonadales bacterium]